MELPLMQKTTFSQTMRLAYQTWTLKFSSTFGTSKVTEAMLQVGSIVDCGNSLNNPLLHPRQFAISA